MADVTVKSFKFRLVAVYVPNIVVERVSSVDVVPGQYKVASLNG